MGNVSIRLLRLFVIVLALAACTEKRGDNNNTVTNKTTGELTLDKSTYDFGDVALGVPATGAVKVTNKGKRNLAFMSISGPTGAFSQTNDCSGAIVPDATCTITFRFQPSSLGSQTGTLAVSYGAAGSTTSDSSFSVALTGKGVSNGRLVVSATRSKVDASATEVVADGVTTVAVTATLEDDDGNTIIGRNVTLASSRGSADTITPATAATDANGTATFTVVSTTLGDAVFTATASGGDAGGSVMVAAKPTVHLVEGAVSQAKSTVEVKPATIAANGSTQVTVMLKDLGAHGKAGKSVTLASSRGALDTITPATATTANDGKATFTVTSTTAGTATLTATDTTDSFTLTNTGTLAVTAAAPSATGSTITANPTTLAADGGATSTITINLRDDYGNPVGGKVVHVTSSRTGSTDTIAPATATTQASGLATFTILSSTAGTAVLTGIDNTDGNLALTNTASVTFNASAVSASKSTVSVAPASVEADGTHLSTVTVTLKDNGNNPVSGKNVTLASSRGGGVDTVTTVSGTTNASGQATFNVKSTTAGNAVVTATDTSDSVVVTQTGTITFTAGIASASKSTVAANPASVTADGTTVSNVTVTLKDANGNPVPGKAVSLASSRGSSDTVAPTSVTSGTDGTAVFTVKSTSPGSAVLTATDTAESVVVTQTATVTFTVGAVSASKSTVTANPLNIEGDGTATSTITITLEDANGHPVAGKTTSLSSSRGGSDSITAISSTTDGNGVARFSVKSSTLGTSTYTATDTTDNVVVTQTASVNFVKGPVSGSKSTVAASPTSIKADGTTTSTITVTLKDSSGNAVGGKSVSLTSPDHNVTFNAASGTTNSSGVVTFTAKSTAAGVATIQATDNTDSITITQTAQITFTPGAVSAAKSTVTAAPPSVVADGTTTSTVTVTTMDVNNNVIPGETVTLTSGRTAGFDTISPASASTNASGQATFTVKSTHVGTATFTAKDGTTTITDTAAVTFTAGAVSPSASTATAAPSSVTANGTTTSTVTITLKDAAGNTVANKLVGVSSSRGADDTIGSDIPTNSSGMATITVKSTKAGTATLTITDKADAIVLDAKPTVTFTAGPVNAGASTAVAAPASLTADGTTTSTITVTLNDVNGNPVSGKTVDLVSSRGATDTITTSPATTNASGVATFTVKSSTIGSSTYTATDKSDTITVSQKPTVTYTAGAVSATLSTVTASPTSIVADNKATTTVTVTLKDGAGNPVSGKTVTLASDPASRDASKDTITTISGTTSGLGVATFTMASKLVGTARLVATDSTDSITLTNAASVTLTPGAGDGNNSTVSASPTTLSTDAGNSSTITVTLKDAFNNLVPGKTIKPIVDLANSTVTPTFNAASAVTNAQGVATFTASSTKTGTARVVFSDSSDSVSIMAPASLTFTPGAVNPANSTIVAAPPTLSPDSTTTSTITVTLMDANKNVVPGKTVALASDRGATDTITPKNGGVTGADGVATFTVLSGTAGIANLTAIDTTDSLTVKSVKVTYDATSVSASHSTITASPTSVLANGTTNSTIVVTLKNLNNGPVSGKSVSLSISPAGPTVPAAATTTSTGMATFLVHSTKTGVFTITATDTTDSVTVLSTVNVTFTPGTVDVAKSTVAASPATLAADNSTTTTITVTLKDVNSNPVSAKHVTLSSSRGASDTISAASGPSDNAGVVTFTVKSKVAGAPVFTAIDSDDSLTITQKPTVTFNAGSFSDTASTVSPATATIVADGTTTQPITVTLRDGFNNPIAGKTVGLSSSRGAAIDTIAGTSTTTNASGQATFTVKSTTAGQTTLTATDVTDANKPLVQTALLTFVAGKETAADSTVAASPTTLVANGTASSTITVTLKDAHNNPVPGKVVTLSSSRTPSGTDSISPGSVTSDAGGVAKFTVTSGTTGTATLTAHVAADSVNITQTATLTFTPDTVSSGSPFAASVTSQIANGTAVTLTATLKDAKGNVVPGKTVSVTSDRNVAHPGTDTISAPAVTNASGVATFTASSKVAGVATFTATDTTDSITLSTSPSVTFKPGPPTAGKSTLVADKASALADNTDSVKITATLKDANDNVVPGKTVSLASPQTGDTISPASGTSTASGTVEFTVKSGTVNNFVFTATDSTDAVTITQTVTVAFTLGPVSPTASTVVASPTSVTANGTTTSTITVTLKDASLKPIPNKTVTLASSRGATDTISGASGPSNTSGVVTFTVKSTTAGAPVFSATGDGIAIQNTATVTFTPGPVSGTVSRITLAPSTVTANGTATSTVSVILKDANGNAVSGKTASLSSTLGTVTPVNGTTSDANGTVKFTVKSATAGNANLAATDTTDGVTLTQSAVIAFLAGGSIVTIAGTTQGFSGDGAAATAAQLSDPIGIAGDGAGTFYVADTLNHRVRKISTIGNISTVVGTGTAGFAGDGGAALSAEISHPGGLVLDPNGNLYIADTGNNRIRKVTPAGVITTVAGDGTAAFGGDGQPATAAQLNAPLGVALDGSGNLYIADTGNHRVRMIATNGVISTIAGNGTAGFAGDGGAATAAELSSPSGVIVDGSGQVAIADTGNHRIRKVKGDQISTVAGTGTAGFSGDGGQAGLAQLSSPHGVALDATGAMYIADTGNHRVRKIATTGVITTVAGNGTDGSTGDGGAATSAALSQPTGLLLDSANNCYVTDPNSNRVRRVLGP